VVLVADVMKGVIAVTVAQAFGSQVVALLTGAAAVVGHNRPVYIGFRGGRGEATTIGVLSVLLPKEVALLVDGEFEVGTYGTDWRPTNLTSGIYVCRMQAGKYVESRKVVLLK